MIVLDTTILVYAVGSEHQYKAPCQRLIRAIASGEILATTTAEVIQELTHVRARRRDQADAAALARDYIELLSPLLAVEEADLREGLRMFEETAGAGALTRSLPQPPMQSVPMRWCPLTAGTPACRLPATSSPTITVSVASFSTLRPDRPRTAESGPAARPEVSGGSSELGPAPRGNLWQVSEAAVTRRFNVRIPVRDGITLSADLALPAGGPAPAVVLRTPYGKSGQTQSQRGEVFAKGGYALVSVDVRGRGDSDGSFEPYRNDGPDGADVIEWAARQDWCTGAVATYGGSYAGKIQWLTALEQPPSLRAMVSLVTPSDPFVEWPTGTPGPMSINWFRLVDGRVPQYQDNVDWMSVYAHRPLLSMDEAAGFFSANWREEMRHTTLDDWWQPHRYQHRISEVGVPVLHISGWYDDEEIGTPANFAAMTAAGHAGQRLLMGPWGHGVNTTQVLGDVDFGPSALIDLDAGVLAFLDEHVRQEPPQTPPAAVRYFVMGANQWREAAQWPPAEATQTVLRLSGGGRANSRYGDGRLLPAPGGTAGAGQAHGADEPPDEWQHDPDHPVPFPTGSGSAQIGGPDDCLGLEGRGDVLVYTGDPLTEPLEIIGPVTVVAYVATSARDTDITAKLVDVHPGGFAQRLCDGMVRLRYRDGCASAQPVVPGEVYEVTIALWDTCVRLDPGHRIRLEIASSAFPKYDVNLGTGGDMITEVTGVTAANRIWHTPQRPSRLVLGQ